MFLFLVQETVEMHISCIHVLNNYNHFIWKQSNYIERTIVLVTKPKLYTFIQNQILQRRIL